jgi:hypothetical protein
MNGSSVETNLTQKNTTMASGIEKPHDIILSVLNTEWHGEAEVHQVITREVAKRAFYKVLESPAQVTIDGQAVNLDKYKVLVADHRNVRDDLDANDMLVPLHIPKAGYTPIDNEQVWDVMEGALKDIGAKITSLCTLERGKKFSISADIGSSEMTINKDKFKAYLNFTTSHDGTIAMNVYDSMIRIVCMNTFRWSMQAMGDVQFKVYHTKNANLALQNLPDLVNAILKGRTELKEVMEYLETCKVDGNEAIAMAMGYFAQTTGTTKLSTRAVNAANEITLLFSRGIGNKGESLYDLANGATEYWTSGKGVGEKNSNANRLYRSAMGSAADHKQAFIGMLANENSRSEALELGKEALALAK